MIEFRRGQHRNNGAGLDSGTFGDPDLGDTPRYAGRDTYIGRLDVSAHPFTGAEQLLWDEQRGKDDDPMRAYGATLLAALITPNYLLLLQLGDGDILIVDSAGRVARPHLEPRGIEGA